MSPKGRHAKSQARIHAYEKLLSQETEKQEKDLELYIPPEQRLGDVVIEAEQVSKAFDGRLLVEDLNFRPSSRRYCRCHRTQRCRQNDPV